MEREIMLTGVGGQGVQLAAQVLARAAVLEDRHVMYMGTYGGTMRGGNTDSSLVIADAPISSPPVVSRTWAAVAMHHQFWEPLRPRVRPGGVVVVNSSVFAGSLELADGVQILDVPATKLATELGNVMTASMVLAAAFARATALVGLDALVDAMREAVPSYRQQHVEANADALRAGYDVLTAGVAPAWETA